jgi:hypothetical protein
MDAADRNINAIKEGGTELVRYQVSSGERVLMGWRRSSGIEVTDRPTEGRARGFVVDRGFRCLEQLTAFVEDYVNQAIRFDDCPMSGRSVLEILADTELDALEPLIAEAG